MGIPYNDTRSHKNDTSMGNNKEVITNADGTNVSTFKIYQPSQIDEHFLDVLSKNFTCEGVIFTADNSSVAPRRARKKLCYHHQWTLL